MCFEKMHQRYYARDAVALAVRRLTYATENRRLEDRLLDSMIAAEAILGDKRSKTEIRYKWDDLIVGAD